MLIDNEMLVINEISSVKYDDKLNEKCRKLSKF